MSYCLSMCLIWHLVNPIRTPVLQPTQLEASRVSLVRHKWYNPPLCWVIRRDPLTVRARYMLQWPVKQLVHCMFNHSWESEPLTRSSGQRTMSPSCKDQKLAVQKGISESLGQKVDCIKGAWTGEPCGLFGVLPADPPTESRPHPFSWSLHT